MICRHTSGDRNCSSHPDHPDRYPSTDAPTVYTRPSSSAWSSNDPGSPDPDRFEIEQTEEIGPHLVIRVRYENCAKCAYEGNKVLVFFNTSLRNAILWKKLDPHFRDPKKHIANPKQAPPPDARFPASPQGWSHAVAFARMFKPGG